MWLKTDITISNKKVEGLVNSSSGCVEIEIPFDSKLLDSNKVTVNGKEHTISEISNVGEREEIIHIKCVGDNNEHKSTESRKGTKLSK